MTKKAHRYYLTQRCVSPGCQPSGFISFDNTEDGQLTNGRRCYGYVDYREPLTPEQVKDYELTPETELVHLREVKTFEDWHEFARRTKKDSYTQYAVPGDIVDEETFDYFLNVLPPASWGGDYDYLQMGEPYGQREIDGRIQATYLTFLGACGKIYFCGDLPAGWSINPNTGEIRAGRA